MHAELTAEAARVRRPRTDPCIKVGPSRSGADISHLVVLANLGVHAVVYVVYTVRLVVPAVYAHLLECA